MVALLAVVFTAAVVVGWHEVAAALVPVLVLVRLELEARRAARERALIRRTLAGTRRARRAGGRREYDPADDDQEAVPDGLGWPGGPEDEA